jgi:hypothetical protein
MGEVCAEPARSRITPAERIFQMTENKQSKNDTKTDSKTERSATGAPRNLAAESANALAYLRTQRLARHGRWALLIDAYEQLVDAAIGIAQDAVMDRPAQLAAIKRLRTHVHLRLAGITDAPIDLDDLGSAVRVLARLAETELHIPGASGAAEAVLGVLGKSGVRRAREGRDFIFV